MSSCSTCIKVNKDVDLINARSEAKNVARETSRPVAIVEEGGEYVFRDPFYAYQNNLPVKEVISHL